MGQYYKPLLIADDGTKQTARSHDYGEGMKLMEHSWIGDEFVNTVLAALDNTPKRLVWMGDYADCAVKKCEDGCYLGGGFINSFDEFMKFYSAAWNDVHTPNLGSSHPRYLLTNQRPDCFVVNLTRNCYIDMEKYVKENTMSGGWCINPVPLLTCIGNGLGGGDYWGDDPGGDIGSWAFDKIYITALKPANKQEVMYHFSE